MISHFGVVCYFINSYGETNCRSCELHTFKRQRLFYVAITLINLILNHLNITVFAGSLRPKKKNYWNGL